MKRKHELRSGQTLETLNHLLEQGIEKISLLIRHSDRFFSEDARLEPFMGLTREGKAYAHDFGQGLNGSPTPQLFSSFFGRCIETAYLIDKGYTQSHGTLLSHNITDPMLAPFYIKDIEQAIHLVNDQGSDLFLRNWFSFDIDETVMENPMTTSDRLCEFMINKVKSLEKGSLSICVSHDWNIFPVKEFKMGLTHETSGDVGYLDGLVFYEDKGQYHVVNYQSDPVPV